MKIEAVISQSVKDGTKPVQQLSNLVLEGLSTKDDSLNTNDGTLYGTFAYSAPTYTLTLYMDSERTQAVASASADSLGMATITAENDSGLSGTVNLIQHFADDGA